MLKTTFIFIKTCFFHVLFISQFKFILTFIFLLQPYTQQQQQHQLPTQIIAPPHLSSSSSPSPFLTTTPSTVIVERNEALKLQQAIIKSSSSNPSSINSSTFVSTYSNTPAITVETSSQFGLQPITGERLLNHLFSHHLFLGDRGLEKSEGNVCPLHNKQVLKT